MPGIERIPEQEADAKEAQYELGIRVRQAIELVIQDIESYRLDKDATTQVSVEPFTLERIATSLDWLDNLAEGHGSIHEHADETEIIRICDKLKSLLEAYVAIKEQAPVAEDIRKAYEIPSAILRTIRILKSLLDKPEYQTLTARQIIAYAISDINTRGSIQLRQRLLELGVGNVCIAFNCVPNADTPESIRFLSRLLDEKTDPGPLLYSVKRYDSPEKLALLDKFRQAGIHINEILPLLSGTDTVPSHQFRRQLIDQGADLSAAIESLANTSSHASIELRRELLRRGCDASKLIASLARVSTPEAMALRVELLRKAKTSSLLVSLEQVDGPESMKIRRDLWDADEKNHTEVLISLNRLASSESIEFRRTILETKPAHGYLIAATLRGVDTPESMQLRGTLSVIDRLKSLGDVSSNASMTMRSSSLIENSETWNLPVLLEILRSLYDIDTPEANRLRLRIANIPEFEGYVGEVQRGMHRFSSSEAMDVYRLVLKKTRINISDFLRELTGVGTPESLRLRQEILDMGTDPLLVAHSLIRTYTDEALDFRERVFGKDPPLYLESFGMSRDFA